MAESGSLTRVGLSPRLPPSHLQQMAWTLLSCGHINGFCRFYSRRKVNSWLFCLHVVIMMKLTPFVNHVSIFYG